MVFYSLILLLSRPQKYMRTVSQTEIDFVPCDYEVAIEVKSIFNANPHLAKGLKSFAEEYTF